MGSKGAMLERVRLILNSNAASPLKSWKSQNGFTKSGRGSNFKFLGKSSKGRPWVFLWVNYVVWYFVESLLGLEFSSLSKFLNL